MKTKYDLIFIFGKKWEEEYNRIELKIDSLDEKNYIIYKKINRLMQEIYFLFIYFFYFI